MEFREFVAGYMCGRVRAHVDRSRAMRVCDKSPLLPRRYRVAHSIWSSISLLLLMGGLIAIIWIPWWAGIGVSMLGFFIAPAVQKSAARFVLGHSLESEVFYNEMIGSGVLKVDEHPGA